VCRSGKSFTCDRNHSLRDVGIAAAEEAQVHGGKLGAECPGCGEAVLNPVAIDASLDVDERSFSNSDSGM
jgi:hypothetical protein